MIIQKQCRNCGRWSAVFTDKKYCPWCHYRPRKQPVLNTLLILAFAALLLVFGWYNL